MSRSGLTASAQLGRHCSLRWTLPALASSSVMLNGTPSGRRRVNVALELSELDRRSASDRKIRSRHEMTSATRNPHTELEVLNEGSVLVKLPSAVVGAA